MPRGPPEALLHCYIGIRGVKKVGFLPPNLFFDNIFFQTYITPLIFFRDATLMLSASFKYLQHGSTTSRKIFEAI